MKIIKYCPTCSLELNDHFLKDIYLVGMSCKNSHYFYTSCKDVLSIDSFRAPSILSPKYNGNNEKEIIEFWLTDIDARAKLNIQLAVMIRRIYEILFENHNISEGHNIFKYCTICKLEIIEYDQPDCWVQGKKCLNSHEYTERGGTIYCTYSGERIALSAEMSNESLIWLIDAWLKDRKHLKKQLHEELFQVIHKYKVMSKSMNTPLITL